MAKKLRSQFISVLPVTRLLMCLPSFKTGGCGASPVTLSLLMNRSSSRRVALSAVHLRSGFNAWRSIGTGLIDTTIRHLVGMHRHVRSVMGSAVCMVYTWDHASNPERYTNSNKSQFVRRKKHYALFHSSAAHVKPPTSGRSVLVVVPVLLAVVAAGFFHFKQRFSPEGAKVEASKKAPIGTAVAATLQHSLAPASDRPKGYTDVPDLSGCWAVGDACSCLATSGRVVRIDTHMCKVTSSSYDGLVQWAPQQSAWDTRPASPAPAASSALPSPPLAVLAGS
jgi:hypothetical protein